LRRGQDGKVEQENNLPKGQENKEGKNNCQIFGGKTLETVPKKLFTEKRRKSKEKKRPGRPERKKKGLEGAEGKGEDKVLKGLHSFLTRNGAPRKGKRKQQRREERERSTSKLRAEKKKKKKTARKKDAPDISATENPEKKPLEGATPFEKIEQEKRPEKSARSSNSKRGVKKNERRQVDIKVGMYGGSGKRKKEGEKGRTTIKTGEEDQREKNFR